MTFFKIFFFYRWLTIINFYPPDVLAVVVAAAGVVACVVAGVVAGPPGVGPVTVGLSTGSLMGVVLSTAQSPPVVLTFVLAPTPLQCQCSHM